MKTRKTLQNTSFYHQHLFVKADYKSSSVQIYNLHLLVRPKFKVKTKWISPVTRGRTWNQLQP